MPAIDGWKLPEALPSMNEAIQDCIDASEVGDVSALLSTDDYLHKQGEFLRDYRHGSTLSGANSPERR